MTEEGNTTEEPVPAVEVYEDVETSVVLHDFGDNLEEGQYIAYIGDEFGESSVQEVEDEYGNKVLAVVTHPKPHICEDCGKQFTDITLYKQHVILSHKGRRHFCDICHHNFKRIEQLRKHMKLVHAEPSNDQPVKKSNPYAKTYLCNTCGRILKSQIAYENHTLRHESKQPFPCAVCSEPFANKGARRKHEVREHNLLEKGNGNPDGYHVCEVCGLEVFSDSAFYNHKDRHRDPYCCTFCDKVFHSKLVLQFHMKRHTSEKAFACVFCDKRFKVKQELANHMNIHTELRVYQCPHCPKTLRKSSELVHHVRTHMGEKPYICDQCGRGFAQVGDMRKHRLLHFKPSKTNE